MVEIAKKLKQLLGENKVLGCFYDEGDVHDNDGAGYC